MYILFIWSTYTFKWSSCCLIFDVSKHLIKHIYCCTCSRSCVHYITLNYWGVLTWGNLVLLWHCLLLVFSQSMRRSFNQYISFLCRWWNIYIIFELTHRVLILTTWMWEKKYIYILSLFFCHMEMCVSNKRLNKF